MEVTFESTVVCNWLVSFLPVALMSGKTWNVWGGGAGRGGAGRGTGSIHPHIFLKNRF